MSKKKIAIIVAIIVVVAAIVASVFIFLKPGNNGNLNVENGNNNAANNTSLNQSENLSSGISSNTTTNLLNGNENTYNENISNANDNANVNLNVNAGNTSTDSKYSSDPNWQSPTYDPNSVTPEYAAEMNRRAEEERQAYRAAHQNDGTGSANAYNNSGDANRIASIDQNAYKNNAAQCIKNMLTFDCNSLKTQEYRLSFWGYISLTPETSDIISTKMDDNYASVMSGYPKFFSQVVTVEPKSVYVSHAQHNNSIAVDCKVTIKKNQGYPGEVAWEVVNLYEESYLVYFDADGKIFDMIIAHSKILQGDLFNDKPHGTR